MTLPEPDRYTAFDSSNSGVTLRGQVVILHSNTVDMPSKNLQEFRLPQVAVIYHNACVRAEVDLKYLPWNWRAAATSPACQAISSTGANMKRLL